MKNRILAVLGSVTLTVAMVVGLGACNKQGQPSLPIKTKLTEVNISKIQPGMTREQVENLLGPPNSTDTKDFVVFKKTNATYIEGKDSLVVTYKNNEVEEKHSTSGDNTTGSTTTTTTTTSSN